MGTPRSHADSTGPAGFPGKFSGPGLAVLLVVFLTLALPLGGILWAGWLDTRSFPAFLDRAQAVLTRGSTWRSTGFSFFQAGVSAALTLVLAIPGSYALARYTFKGKGFIQALGMASFVLPSLLIILAVMSFYGRAGVLNQILGTRFSFVYSPVGIILAHLMFNLAIGLRMLTQGWLDLDQRLVDASRSLGDSSLGRLRRLALPFLGRRMVSAFLLIFLYCFLSFSIVLIFGGVGFITLEVLIYREMYVSLSPAGAAVLVLLQLLVTGLVVALSQFWGRSVQRGARPVEVKPMGSLSFPSRILWGLYWTLVYLFLLAPLGALMFRSFWDDGALGFAAYRSLFLGTGGRGTGPGIFEVMRATTGQVFLDSLVLALSSGTASVLLGYLVARLLSRRDFSGSDTLFLLPLVVSGVTLSLGMGQVLSSFVSRWILIVLVQTVMAFPLVFRIFREGFRSFPPSYQEAAKSLGAGTWFRIRTLELPLLWPIGLQAFAFGAAISLGDFTGVYTLGRGEVVTVPIAMFRLIGFQHFPAALALGVCYIMVTLGVFLLIDSFDRRKKEGRI